ncbi:uncharacterized protein LOC129188782 isoform X2 [Dunckerocampus dactyliophorus]|uniref:uncharacterized protein LOC129188782 isoform X2 n=1 Tax=Dunckerocampus dactyliophorus TaxID=161453 RepID=UPI002404EEBB|nr:uncharacterized protein LOC129188782 isoform X2 [Dunckerocampus dactyliophorus]
MRAVQMLRALMVQRLNATVEEIFGLFERTIAEYEEELSRTKVENERQRELLDKIFKQHARLHKADVHEVSVKSQKEIPFEWSSGVNNKEEEDEQQMTTEADGEHFEENTHSEPDSIFAPLSDMDDTSDSSETNHRDDTKESLESNKDSKDVQQVSVESQEEIPSVQQEWRSSVRQLKPEPPDIKEKEDEQHITTKADEDFEDNMQSEPDWVFAPLSDTNDMSDSSELDHSDNAKEPLEKSKDSKGTPVKGNLVIAASCSP